MEIHIHVRVDRALVLRMLLALAFVLVNPDVAPMFIGHLVQNLRA